MCRLLCSLFNDSLVFFFFENKMTLQGCLFLSQRKCRGGAFRPSSIKQAQQHALFSTRGGFRPHLFCSIRVASSRRGWGTFRFDLEKK